MVVTNTAILIGQEKVTNCACDRHLHDSERHLQVYVTHDLNLLDTVSTDLETLRLHRTLGKLDTYMILILQVM